MTFHEYLPRSCVLIKIRQVYLQDVHCPAACEIANDHSTLNQGSNCHHKKSTWSLTLIGLVLTQQWWEISKKCVASSRKCAFLSCRCPPFGPGAAVTMTLISIISNSPKRAFPRIVFIVVLHQRTDYFRWIIDVWWCWPVTMTVVITMVGVLVPGRFNIMVTVHCLVCGAD